MTQHEASRTLVKSPPELWAECSEASSLSRHLEEFGEIRITRLEPEIAVAWEGEHASGTVRLEPSGWGTRVILTARAEAVGESEAQASLDPELEPAPAPPPAAAVPARATAAVPARRGLVGRLLGWLRLPAPALERRPAVERAPAMEGAPALEGAPAMEGAPAIEGAPAGGPGPDLSGGPNPATVLSAALDSLGQAHRRPFSRA